MPSSDPRTPPPSSSKRVKRRVGVPDEREHPNTPPLAQRNNSPRAPSAPNVKTGVRHVRRRAGPLIAPALDAQ